MDKLPPSSSSVLPPLGPLVDVLRAVVQRLSEPPFLFVIGISIIVALLVFGIIAIAPEIDESVRAFLTVIGVAAIVVIGVLALTALIGGIITTAIEMRKEQSGETEPTSPDRRARQRRHPTASQDGAVEKNRNVTQETTMNEQPGPQDCAKLKRQLDSARMTLDELEVQAAGIPELERTATFSRNLTEQREKVVELERKLAECLEQETQQ